MSNFLENIEIKNFKSIRHQKIEGCRRINVFIGYPNVGKSNILEAMSLLSYLIEPDVKLNKLARLQDFTELFFDSDISENIEVSVTTSDFSTKKQGVDITFERDEELELTHFAVKNVEPVIVKEIKLSKQGSNSLKDRRSSFTTWLEDYEAPVIKKYHYRVETTNEQKGYHSLFFPEGQNLFYIIERNGDLRKEVIDLLSFYGLKLLFDKGDKYSMKVMKELNDDTIVSIPFHQIADTLQRLIFYKAAIQTNKDSVLLFEEPEAHMFPPYIRKFTSDVVFDKSNQFFIATHSPYVLDELIEEAKDELAIFLVDYKDGETIIKNLSEKSLNEIKEFGVDLFFNLESYLKNDG